MAKGGGGGGGGIKMWGFQPGNRDRASDYTTSSCEARCLLIPCFPPCIDEESQFEILLLARNPDFSFCG